MLRRAISIIEREMNKGSSLMQSDSMSAITNALKALLDSNVVNSMNKAKVQALLQSGEDMDDLQPAGAPAPDAYKSHSGSILSTLEDMLEKASAQRADGQKAEMISQHNFDLLAQKLNDEIADQEKQMKATNMVKATAYDVEKQERAEELKAL